MVKSLSNVSPEDLENDEERAWSPNGYMSGGEETEVSDEEPGTDEESGTDGETKVSDEEPGTDEESETDEEPGTDGEPDDDIIPVDPGNAKGELPASEDDEPYVQGEGFEQESDKEEPYDFDKQGTEPVSESEYEAEGGFDSADLTTLLGAIFVDPKTNKNIAEILSEISRKLTKLVSKS